MLSVFDVVIMIVVRCTAHSVVITKTMLICLLSKANQPFHCISILYISLLIILSKLLVLHHDYRCWREGYSGADRRRQWSRTHQQEGLHQLRQGSKLLNSDRWMLLWQMSWVCIETILILFIFVEKSQESNRDINLQETRRNAQRSLCFAVFRQKVRLLSRLNLFTSLFYCPYYEILFALPFKKAIPMRSGRFWLISLLTCYILYQLYSKRDCMSL